MGLLSGEPTRIKRAQMKLEELGYKQYTRLSDVSFWRHTENGRIVLLHEQSMDGFEMYGTIHGGRSIEDTFAAVERYTNDPEPARAPLREAGYSEEGAPQEVELRFERDQTVRVTAVGHRQGQIGIIDAVDDGDKALPYFVRFSAHYEDTDWFRDDELEAAEDA